MSRIDEEITNLRLRIAALEEQKRVEMENAADKKANPLKSLETIATDTKKSVEYYQKNKQWHDRIHASRAVEYLEEIIEALKQIQNRLDVLEQK